MRGLTLPRSGDPSQVQRQLATGRPRRHPWPMEIPPDLAAVAPKGTVPGAVRDSPEPEEELDVEAFLAAIDDEHLVAVLREALAVQGRS